MDEISCGPAQSSERKSDLWPLCAEWIIHHATLSVTQQPWSHLRGTKAPITPVARRKTVLGLRHWTQLNSPFYLSSHFNGLLHHQRIKTNSTANNGQTLLSRHAKYSSDIFRFKKYAGAQRDLQPSTLTRRWQWSHRLFHCRDHRPFASLPLPWCCWHLRFIQASFPPGAWAARVGCSAWANMSSSPVSNNSICFTLICAQVWPAVNSWKATF